MKLKNNLKILIIRDGWKSIRQFTQAAGLNYEAVVRLVNDTAKSIDKELLVELCEHLDCRIEDIFEIDKGQAS